MSEPPYTLVATPLKAPPAAFRPSATLAIETTAVTIAAVAAVRLLHVSRPGGLHWLLIPCALVMAALAPTWVARRDFPRVGLHAESIGPALGVLAVACLCSLPPVFLVMWLLTSCGLSVPLRPTLGREEQWLTWLLYQFLYVAAAEEVFFRGYLQANAMRILGRKWAAIATSAGLFALAHVVVQGQIVSILTFLPGLLMAWLFVRTRSLLAPILFHGLANVSYGILAATLA